MTEKAEILKILNTVQGVNCIDFDITEHGTFRLDMAYKNDVINPSKSAVEVAELLVKMREQYPDYIRIESIKAMVSTNLPS